MRTRDSNNARNSNSTCDSNFPRAYILSRRLRSSSKAFYELLDMVEPKLKTKHEDKALNSKGAQHPLCIHT